MQDGPQGRCGRRGALIEPVVLAVLQQEPSHGYDLRRAISELTGGALNADVGGLYRTLRRLEQDGFVTSSWSEGESGPQRRDYRITEEGRELAKEWAVHLRERAQIICLVADAIESYREAGGPR